MARRVLYLLDSYANPNAGTENQLFSLIQNLDRKRFAPSIAVFRSTSYVESQNLPCPLTVLNIYKIKSLKTMIGLASYSRSLRRQGTELVHILFNDASIIAPVFLKQSGLKVLVSRRDMGFWYTPLTLRALRISKHFVDCFVANSQAVAQRIHQAEGISLDRIRVIYNGFDPKRFRQVACSLKKTLGIPKSGRIIGAVANLRPIKRLDDLIRAFALITGRHTELHLVIVGDDRNRVGASTLKGSLETLATSLGVGHRVHFTGPVENTLPLIKHFSVGVLCSESEGLPNALIEYAACGKPLIGTNTGGIPEIIRDGHNGFLVPVGDIGAIATRLDQVLSMPEVAQTLGENAMCDVKERFALRNMVDAHMQAYEDLLATDRI